MIFFTAWERASLGKFRWNHEKARRFRFRVLAGQCFASWSKYALRVTTGLAPSDAAKPEVFFVGRHSEARIAQHFRRVTLRKHLRYWRKFAHPRQIVRRKLLMLRAFNARRALEAWKKAAKRQKQIKQRVVNEWREHCTLLVQVRSVRARSARILISFSCNFSFIQHLNTNTRNIMKSKFTSDQLSRVRSRDWRTN